MDYDEILNKMIVGAGNFFFVLLLISGVIVGSLLTIWLVYHLIVHMHLYFEYYDPLRGCNALNGECLFDLE